MNLLKTWLAKRGVTVALYTVVVLILFDTLFTYQYKQSLNDNIEEHKMLNEIKRNKDMIITNLNGIDMSLRGFLLVGNEAFVDTYNKIKRESAEQMGFLEKSLPTIGLSPAVLNVMNEKHGSYFKLMDQVIDLEKAGNHEQALAILKEDHGTAVWMKYVELSNVIDPVIKGKADASDAAYNRLLSLNMYFQIVLFLIGIPTLIYTSIRLLRNEQKRIRLYRQLDDSNRRLIFDSAKPIDIEDEKVVISEMINNLDKTSGFIQGIASGNYDVKWHGYDASEADNSKNISGQLLHMREEMKKKQEELKKQQWVSKGLNDLNSLIREHQDNFSILAEKSVSFIVNYLHAQQASLFSLNDKDANDQYLEMVSCYAYNRKKFLHKRLELGEGLIGQTYLEGEPVFLKNIPNDYVTITSGLGEANPRCISIYPLKHNEKVIAMLEIASFNMLDEFALDFLANACRDLGSTFVNIRNNEKTRELLETTQQQAEAMRAQEEEMRQNLEELEATQEEMKRRENELKMLLEQTKRAA